VSYNSDAWLSDGDEDEKDEETNELFEGGTAEGASGRPVIGRPACNVNSHPSPAKNLQISLCKC